MRLTSRCPVGGATIPGDRPVRAGHRRVCVPAAGRWRGPCFFTRALATTKVIPVEVTTDKAAVYPNVVNELAPGAWHGTEVYANNRMEADHGQLKRRLRPMRGLKATTKPGSSSLGTRSSRTPAAATTNSVLKKQPACGWRPPSTSWPWRSDQTEDYGLACLGFAKCNNAW